jgi:hypothetical protein
VLLLLLFILIHVNEEFYLNSHQRLAAGQWFSLGILISSIHKTDRHDITEILLKVALNTIHLNQTSKIGEEGINVSCK